MASIAIIDDNPDMGESLQLVIKQYLENAEIDWSVLEQFPFDDLNEYFKFIEDNDVCVLILDERLNTRKLKTKGPVNYKGSELVSLIRERLKDFPIFSITTYPEDNELENKFSEFEFILRREDFVEEGNKYVPIIIRSANRYLETNQKELNEFGDLTKEIAGGDTDPAKIEKLNALQLKLELPFSGFEDRQNWLNIYESHISNLEKIKNELKKKNKK